MKAELRIPINPEIVQDGEVEALARRGAVMPPRWGLRQGFVWARNYRHVAPNGAGQRTSSGAGLINPHNVCIRIRAEDHRCMT